MILPEQYEEGRGPYAEIANLKAEIDRLRVWLGDSEMTVSRLRAALKDLLANDLAEDCQECGIGHTPQWKRAKALVKEGK